MGSDRVAVRIEEVGVSRCPMCDSAEWVGYLRCRTCRRYFVSAKCKNCGSLRLKRCPLDDGELDLVPSDGSVEGE